MTIEFPEKVQKNIKSFTEYFDDYSCDYDDHFNIGYARCKSDGSDYYRYGYTTCLGDLASDISDLGDDDYVFIYAKDEEHTLREFNDEWGDHISKNLSPRNADYPVEHIKDYIEWLVKDSPFRRAFVVKDPKWILENRVFILTTSAPVQEWYGAGMAIRFYWEQPSNFCVWVESVRLGCNPTLAYVLAHLFHTDKYKKGEEYKIRKYSCSHVAISSLSGSWVKSFVKDNPQKIKSYTGSSYSGGWSVSSYWGDVNNDRFVDNMYHKKDDDNLYIFFNPSKHKSATVFEGEEGLSYIIKEMTEEYLESKD